MSDLKTYLSHTNYIYYNKDGTFSVTSIGCGCCSDSTLITKEEAVQVAESMIKKWQETLAEINAVTTDQMKEDILKNL